MAISRVRGQRKHKDDVEGEGRGEGGMKIGEPCTNVFPFVLPYTRSGEDLWSSSEECFVLQQSRHYAGTMK